MSKVLLHATVGAPVHGELFSPPVDRAPALIVLHEWWGLNDGMRDLARRYASEDFLTLALDLFGGQVTADPNAAAGLAQGMKTRDALVQIQAAVDWLKTQPGCNGKVGITGFCLGGGVSLATACNVRGLSAVAPFYGIPLPQYLDASTLEAPIQGHYAQHDGYVSAARLTDFQAAASAAGRPGFELFTYDAGHAFMRVGDAAAYNAAAAALAWDRTLAFLRAHLTA